MRRNATQFENQLLSATFCRELKDTETSAISRDTSRVIVQSGREELSELSKNM